MQYDEIQVDVPALRRCAADLAGTGYLLGHGLAGTSGLTVAAPEWSAADALARVESAVNTFLNAVGARSALAADGLRAAAEAYEAVDDRVAVRLNRTR